MPQTITVCGIFIGASRTFLMPGDIVALCDAAIGVPVGLICYLLIAYHRQILILTVSYSDYEFLFYLCIFQ
jgi:hypothetical protein